MIHLSAPDELLSIGSVLEQVRRERGAALGPARSDRGSRLSKNAVRVSASRQLRARPRASPRVPCTLPLPVTSNTRSCSVGSS